MRKKNFKFIANVTLHQFLFMHERLEWCAIAIDRTSVFFFHNFFLMIYIPIAVLLKMLILSPRISWILFTIHMDLLCHKKKKKKNDVDDDDNSVNAIWLQIYFIKYLMLWMSVVTNQTLKIHGKKFEQTAFVHGHFLNLNFKT